MYFTVETMRLGGDWPRVTNFVVKDKLITLFYTHPGYSWKFVLNRNFSDYNCFIAQKSFSFSVLFTLYFVSIKERIENRARRATSHNVKA